ncbi:MAG: UbiA family prenyltransferase [Candidatus Kapabacteria bacterium]|nr:UbiA family prenyltransferase [Candidatus Kapabacteria bacterium]
MPENNNMNALCVDLDGTIISTDTLLESALAAAKINPFNLILMLLWLLKGRANLKKKIADIAIPEPAALPWREDVLDYIKEEKAKGREIVFATATQQRIADSIAEHLGIFDKVLASSAEHNLRSENKRKALVDLYGEKGFDYIGDSKADFKVWKFAANALVVQPSDSFLKKVKSITNVSKVFKHEHNKFRLIIKELRIYQWLKNLLVIIPLLLAHRLDSGLIGQSVLAFFAFGMTASFVYVLNDLLDLTSDRLHPRKRKRPLASGALSIPSTVIFSPLLLLGGATIAVFLLPANFAAALGVYFVLTTFYSFVLKRIVIVDVITLSSLYTLRLIAGALAVDVVMSAWLLAFSIFFFLSLAMVKRFTEIKVMIEENKTKLNGRGYETVDINLIQIFGMASGYISAMILTLYVNSSEVAPLYSTPEFLWPVALCLLFWISRIWFIATRGQMDDDPIVFTSKDPVSYIVGFIVLILVIGATI